MPELEILKRLALAAAVGLLFGIERGWQLRDQKAGSRVAGIRTFTLIGLFGGVCGLLATAAGPLVLGLALFGFAIAFSLLQLRRMRASGNFSATELVAGLLTFALGAYGVQGSMTATGAVAVLAALVLAERRILHGFLKRVTWLELRAALLLLVMTVVLLPVLPNRTIDPFGAVNPYEIWLMTVLIAAVSFGGYIAMRLSGESRGLFYAGAMGGLVTSTTVTYTFARLARRHPGMLREVAAAILAAWIVSLTRMTSIALLVAPGLAPALVPPMAAAGLALLLPAAICFTSAGRSQDGALPLRNPFELAEVLKFGALLTVIMLCGKAASLWFGPAGLSTLGALTGLVDVDPITLSMARSVGEGTVTAAFGASVILLAALSNAGAKAVMGSVFGGWHLGLLLTGSMAAAVTAGGLVLLLTT